MSSVADLLVQRLLEAGVTAIFGVPGGGSNLDLIEAASRAHLPFVLTSTETAAAIAAMAHAEVTGAPGVCLTTLGPGAASAVNGVACASLDRAPLIVFTDSHPAAAEGCSHQRLDHHALFAPVAKWSVRLTAEHADETICEALARALTPPCGPVHLDCPGDVLSVDSCQWPVASQAASGSAKAFALHESASAVAVHDSHARVRSAKALAEGLRGSHRPVLLVGLGARRQAEAAAIRAFCETRRVPAMVTYKAKGVVPDDHPWFAGIFTNGAIERPLLDEADLLIGIGLDPVELIPRRWTAAAPIVYGGPSEVPADQVPFAAQLLADIPAVMRELDIRLPPSGWTPDRIREAISEQRARIAFPSTTLNAQRAIALAAARLAPTARVTVDAGAHMFPATMLWPVSEPNGLLISNGLSTMGFALPAAIGAALADRGRPVVALTGDGGLLMCVAELATAVREQLDIIVIVFADEALSLIQIKQEGRAMPPVGVTLGGVSWTRLAESFGAAGFAASNESELNRALDQALAVRGPSLIEARIDPSNYGPMLRAVRG
jgi:acetolactate synthase I/II/III large subunit